MKTLDATIPTRIVVSICVASVIFFAIGCEQVLDQIKRDLSGDTDVPSPDDKVPAPDSISKDEVVPSDDIQTGTVVITDTDGNWGNDEYTLNNVTITGDTLKLNVSYTGGCKTHQFTLVTSGSFLESSPVQLVISIAHNANDDPCEAYPTEDYHFDLNPIKTLYQEAYQQESGTIILLLEDAPPNTQLVYQFTM